VESDAATDEDGATAAARADAAALDACAAEECARVAFAFANGDDETGAASTADATVAGASTRGCGAGADVPVTGGIGPLAAVRCARAAGLRPFACMSNCRAASRVRQYPAAYTLSTAAQLAATSLFEIRPLPLPLGMRILAGVRSRVWLAWHLWPSFGKWIQSGVSLVSGWENDCRNPAFGTELYTYPSDESFAGAPSMIKINAPRARGQVLTGALTVLFLTAAALAHPFHVEDMQSLARVGEVRISPDGLWAAFTVTRSDVVKNRTVTNLWRVPTAGGEPQQLTFVEHGSNGSPRWSSDGRYLYFLSSRVDDKSQVFRLAVAGGEAKQITNFGAGVDDFVLSPDGNTLAITISVFPSCSDMACNEKRLKEQAEDPVKARVITDIPFRRWDGWIDGQRNHILIMPSEGGSATDLTPGDVDSPIWPGEEGGEEVAFSPDGRELCFSRYVENESLSGNSDLFVVPVSGGTPKAITTNKSTDRTPRYSPNGRYIAYSATLRPMQETDFTRVFIYDRTTGEHRNLSEALDRSIASFAWSPDSSSLYLTFESHGEVSLARLDIATLQLRPLFTSGTSDEPDVARDNRFLIFANSTLARPAELFRLDLAGATNPAPTQLTHFNQEALKGIEFGEASSFTFRGWHGEPVQAWQVKPPGFDPSRKYPLLLLMHGGPEGAWDNQFHYRWNAQVFAAAGYVVIQPNFHGSMGFGIKFMDAIKGQWGGAPVEDQMKAVDTALTWPYVDATRVAAAGGSYGGYMANWLEGHTDRFRAIVSHDGLYDLLTAIYSADFVGGTLQEFKGTPWENPKVLIDQAPVTYARNFRTPMLIIHGGNDYRVDRSQGLAMFQALQAMHVPSKLLYFEAENHWVLKPADSILWYHTVIGWIDQWVRPDRAEYQRLLTAASHAGTPGM
jgi:dipeptidyl aminopeptidase/acylaminoacyl peptidase